MSETIHAAERRKELLKHMIRQLNKGEAVDTVRQSLVRLLGTVPYEQVVEVEQELMAEGLPQEEILKLCDVHAQALRGHIEKPEQTAVPAGHPLDVFQEENRAILWEVSQLDTLFSDVTALPDDADATEPLVAIQPRFFALADVEKHYQRKENLLFSFLERHEITGPSTVMWGKHDEIREMLKAGIEALEATEGPIQAGELEALIAFSLKPAVDAISEMVMKEEEILFPMAMKTLTPEEWAAIHHQTADYGYCLVEPSTQWTPDAAADTHMDGPSTRVRFETGSLTPEELSAILNTIPFDMTFVDADDTVRYFTRGQERIFARSKAIIGRKVQRCHPPKSMHIVERILGDFKSGRQNRAAFWINMGGKFIHIEYFALRGEDGRYLGTLEVSQDLTEKRALQGERRLLTYDENNPEPGHDQS